MKSLYWRRKACRPDFFFFAASLVGAVLLEALLRLSRAQPFRRIDLQLLCDGLRCHCVPLGLCGLRAARCFCHVHALPSYPPSAD